MEKLEEIYENLSDFTMDHPVAWMAVCYAIGIVVSIPLCRWSYRHQAKVTAREVARLLK